MSRYLYLEPFSFIFRNDVETVIYNSFSGEYLYFPELSYAMHSILNVLENPDNGYCACIDDNLFAEDLSVRHFIERVSESHSGGMCEADIKPFIINPICKIYDSLERMRKGNGEFNGRKVLRNLNEVELYLSEGHPSDQIHAYPPCRQFLSNNFWKEVTPMSKEMYLLLLMHLSVFRIPKVNFLNVSTCSFLHDIMARVNEYHFKKCFYLSDIDELMMFSEYDKGDVDFVIDITSRHSISEYVDALNTPAHSLVLRKIVGSEDEIEHINELYAVAPNKINIVPYYNGDNIDFFKTNVFNTIYDILSLKSKKIDIHRRQTLNEHFFGKLYILPNGDTYGNLNMTEHNNITKTSLAEIVYKEMSQSSSWFLTRGKIPPCKTCVNRMLCPSLTNFELTTGIYNMCDKYEG